MALALKVLNAPSGDDNSQKRTILQGTGKLTGSYAAGGEAINWETLVDVSGAAVLLNSLSSTPLWAEFQIGIPGATPLWFLLQYNYTTGKLQIAVTGAAAGDGFEQLAAGAYPADLTAAIIYWKAEFLSE